MRTLIALLVIALVGPTLGCTPSKDGATPAAAPTSAAQASGAASTAPASQAAASAPASQAAAPAPKAPAGDMYAGSHILVAYTGAMRAKPTLTRTKAEALAKAKDLVTQARGGADFAKLAAAHSDGPSAARGGSLGAWKKGRMVPEFDKAVSGMQVGDISEPVETGFGYHVIRRDPPPEVRTGAHILIAYKGAMRASPAITRTKEEALAKAKGLVTEARANPAAFAELAKANSDGPSAPRGGSLGTWTKGKMVPAFDTAIDSMKVGDISEPVETDFGFHVILRTEAK